MEGPPAPCAEPAHPAGYLEGKTSRNGRYQRFDEKLGSGAYKKVYKGYDTEKGVEVAWNVTSMKRMNRNDLKRLGMEVELLKKLDHKNIIGFENAWVNKERQEAVFITELVTAGALQDFISRVKVVRWKIIKRWCRSILDALAYLHSQTPPIIHRDMKCSNIFVNGATGELLVGDFGISTTIQSMNGDAAMSMLGTPEFMAPELYEEMYDEKVDIYAFGMCVLEMITKELPYMECQNPAQIYRKVSQGMLPNAIRRIPKQAALEFILVCLGVKHMDDKIVVKEKQPRPSAQELLEHPFLKDSPDDGEEVLIRTEEEEEAGNQKATAPRPVDVSANTCHTSGPDSSVSSAVMVASMPPETALSTSIDQAQNKAHQPQQQQAKQHHQQAQQVQQVQQTPQEQKQQQRQHQQQCEQKQQQYHQQNQHQSTQQQYQQFQQHNISSNEYQQVQQQAGQSQGGRATSPTLIASAFSPDVLHEDQKASIGAGAGDLLPIAAGNSIGGACGTSSESLQFIESDNQFREWKDFKEIPTKGDTMQQGQKRAPDGQVYVGEILQRSSKGGNPFTMYLLGLDPQEYNKHTISIQVVIDASARQTGSRKTIAFQFAIFKDSAHDVAADLAKEVCGMHKQARGGTGATINGAAINDMADCIGEIVFNVKSIYHSMMDESVWEDAPVPFSFDSIDVDVSKSAAPSSAAPAPSASATRPATTTASATTTAARIPKAAVASSTSEHFDVAIAPLPFEVSPEEAKRQLIMFYERSFPEKLSSVDEVMKRYEGREHDIIKKIRDHDRKKAAKDADAEEKEKEKKKPPHQQGGDAG